jgi:ribosome biogenesis GTPase
VQGKITVLAGPSGSGKSSLLNALNSDLQLRVGEISEKIQRGQHTTRHVELLMPDENDDTTLIADTPGFSNLKFNTVLPVQIAKIYRDFADLREQCVFSDCLHLDEEGCAVLANQEDIAASRYASYRDLMSEARQYKAEADAASQKDEFGYKKIDRKGKNSLKILRLKGKDRDLSRRRVKQQFSQADILETSEDD